MGAAKATVPVHRQGQVPRKYLLPFLLFAPQSLKINTNTPTLSLQEVQIRSERSIRRLQHFQLVTGSGVNFFLLIFNRLRARSEID